MPNTTTICRFVRIVLWQSIVCVYLLLAQGGTARAQNFDISVLFTPLTMSGMPNDVINYTAMFTNNTGNDLLINGGTLNSSDPNFTDFGSLFNGNGVGTGEFQLAAHQSATVNDVISLFLGSTVTPGDYTLDGTFSGRNFSDAGNTGVNDRDLGTGPLQIHVTNAPTPEFGSVVSLGGLLVAGGVGLWRQRRRRGDEPQEHAAPV